MLNIHIHILPIAYPLACFFLEVLSTLLGDQKLAHGEQGSRDKDAKRVSVHTILYYIVQDKEARALMIELLAK